MASTDAWFFYEAYLPDPIMNTLHLNLFFPIHPVFVFWWRIFLFQFNEGEGLVDQ